MKNQTTLDICDKCEKKFPDDKTFCYEPTFLNLCKPCLIARLKRDVKNGYTDVLKNEFYRKLLKKG